MTLPVIAASVFLLLQTAKGSIEGVVVNSMTNKPIPGAQVNATRMPAVATGGPAGTITTGVVGGVIGVAEAGRVITAQGPLNPPVQIPPVTTDTNGHFVFADLEPGRYLLRAAAEGYARQEYSTRPGDQNGMTAQVELSAGQTSKDTVLHLIPGGTVSGRVTGSNGEPLVNIEVSLLRSTYDGDGRKTLQQSGAAQTNDRGEYRLFWVTPGRYYLSAASSNRPLPGVPFNSASLSNKYPRTYYPSATDPAAAAVVEVQPAAELGGMDFRLAAQPTYRIRGRVVDSASGQIPSRGVSIFITPRESIVNTGVFSSGSPYNPADGTFELRDIPSGSYLIRAQLPFNGRPEPGQPLPVPATATAPVDVAGSDVDGVVLNFVPPVSISGRIRLEGSSSVPDVGRTNVFLRPATAGPSMGPMPRPAQGNPDGTFRIDGILPGEYRMTANVSFGGEQQSALYVKEIRLGSQDILAHPLTVSGPISDTIDVVYAKDAGQISGTVQSDSQQTLSNIQVVLIPNQRERHDLYRVSNTDGSGHFTFRTVPPGSYKVFAWQDIERSSWFDPEVLRVYESRGMPANVSPSSNVTLDLKVIPAGSR